MKIQEKEIILVFRHLLKLLEVRISFNDLNEYWQSHPDYLSMIFFADVCQKYKIDYVALEITSSDISKGGFPFITQLVNEGGHFVIVEDIYNSKVTYYQPLKGRMIIPLKDFLNQWGGSVFYAFPNEYSGETDYLIKRTKELIYQMAYPFFWIILFILLVSSLFLFRQILTQMFVMLLVIKILGLFVCVNLIYHELIGENRISQTICNSNKYTSCNEVLQSPASQIWGVQMSDLGFIYFSTGTTALIFSLFLNIQSITFYLLFIFTICSIPYVIFSIYYQLFRIRKICPFCMFVILILILECVWTLFHLDVLIKGHLICWEVLFPICFLLLIICGWLIMKPIIRKVKDGSFYKYKYLRLKKNPQIFNASLEKAQSFNMEILPTELILGNPEATITITTVVNTNCAPCARMHRRINSILEEFGNDVRVIVRFMLVNNNQKETFYFIRLYYLKGASIFSEALHDWYQDNNYNYLIRKYFDVQKYALEDKLIQHWVNWYDKTKISSTPTIFLNDKKIEQEYDMDDIRWLVLNLLYDESE